MKSTLLTILSGALLLMMSGCRSKISVSTGDILSDNIKNAITQYSSQVRLIGNNDKIMIPRTLDEHGEIVYMPCNDWSSAFFSGSLWYIYDLTKDTKWENWAAKYTESLDSISYLTHHDDVGFMVGSSFLNGMRIGGRG